MCLFLLRTQTNMSNIIAGNRGGGRGGAAATAITVALILILMASPVILATTTTTKAFAAPISNKDCKDIQFRPYESSSFYSRQADHTITIGTSLHEYSVKVDYVKVYDDIFGSVYYKNVDAKDPKGRVLLPGGETITITLVTQEGGGNVFLYNDKVSDCQILLGHVQDKDKMPLKTVSIELSDEFPSIVKQTVQVPDASDVVGKHFTKLGIQLKYNPEVHEILSNISWRTSNDNLLLGDISCSILYLVDWQGPSSSFIMLVLHISQVFHYLQRNTHKFENLSVQVFTCCVFIESEYCSRRSSIICRCCCCLCLCLCLCCRCCCCRLLPP